MQIISKDNQELKNLYNQVYDAGESNFFTFFENGKHISEDHSSVLELVKWSGRTVLDVGCGTGMLAREIASRGALNVIGLDYSASAIDIANKITNNEKIVFLNEDIFTWKPETEFDVITALGVVEHTDDPSLFINILAKLLHQDGCLIIACPHFLNVRGYIWMSLVKLFEVPMSLSDLHFLHPWHIQHYAEKAGLRAQMLTTVHREWAYGPRLIKDFDKRILNALNDVNFSTHNVDMFMTYISELVNHFESREVGEGMEGATAIWRLSQR